MLNPISPVLQHPSDSVNKADFGSAADGVLISRVIEPQGLVEVIAYLAHLVGLDIVAVLALLD